MITAVKDKITTDWIRNRSDELAAENGCWFDVEAGAFAVWWIERLCRLYEGHHAGEPVRLYGCLECQRELEIPDDYDPEQAIKRAEQYIQCRKAGHQVGWQYECTMRMFGWQKHSEFFGRAVRRFSKASIYIAKKNAKSPTLAAWGMFLLIGDGEPGQKCFSCAKDGKQAREISHKHAEEMIRQSPELMEVCKINKSTGAITHEPERSIWRVVSGDNQKSQEGINGSVLIDETHVVDRRLVKIISRAGISRPEPFHIEVSTAGNDPDSYGKERFDYGRQVESGAIEDQSLFFAGYFAPQDLTAEQLEEDPVYYGKLANPMWGVTIREEEYLDDYHRSKHSISELAQFMMYRLDVWQKTSNPWLKSSDWNRCYEDYTPESLYGQECWLGADLSKTRDMSAVVLVFRGDNDGEFRCLPFFWMTEAYAQQYKDKATFLEWAAAGHLYLTSGDVIDYGAIQGKIRELAEDYAIQEFIYDNTYAEMLFQDLSQGRFEGNVEVIPALGIERYEFTQGIASYAGPSDEFEGLVREGKLHHANHPVLSWQAGHVNVKRDAGGRVMPQKPAPNDYRKIDGIQALIMALSRAMLAPESTAWGITVL